MIHNKVVNLQRSMYLAIFGISLQQVWRDHDLPDGFSCFVESASNDSFAYPFISIALYLTMEPNRGKDMRDWILIGWLCMTCSGFVSKLRLIVNERKDQVVLGILIGALIGRSWLYRVKRTWICLHDFRLSFFTHHEAFAQERIP